MCSLTVAVQGVVGVWGTARVSRVETSLGDIAAALRILRHAHGAGEITLSLDSVRGSRLYFRGGFL